MASAPASHSAMTSRRASTSSWMLWRRSWKSEKRRVLMFLVAWLQALSTASDTAFSRGFQPSPDASQKASSTRLTRGTPAALPWAQASMQAPSSLVLPKRAWSISGMPWARILTAGTAARSLARWRRASREADLASSSSIWARALGVKPLGSAWRVSTSLAKSWRRER